MDRIFKDRRQAGQLLGAQLNLLSKPESSDALILALPRGGVLIGYEVSQILKINMDVLIVRKIGHPVQNEYGIGAITEEGYRWIDPGAVGVSELSDHEIALLIEKGENEVKEQIEKYRNNEPLPSFNGKNVIIVDDGLATGVTAKVASRYVRSKGATKVTLAIPVCSERTAIELRSEIDNVVCLNESSFFQSVGQFYLNFDPVSDDEILNILVLAKTRVVNRQRGGGHAVQAVLRGINFPKAKKDVIDFARRHKSRANNGARVIKFLRDLPDRQYHSMAELLGSLYRF